MTRLRHILAGFLALLILTTGQAAAVARGMSGAVDMWEICAGTSVIMIYTDADGEQTAPPHLCPDWAGAWLKALGDSPQMAPRNAGFSGVTFGQVVLTPAQSCLIEAVARGPPAEV